jgi:hypothetical protein
MKLQYETGLEGKYYTITIFYSYLDNNETLPLPLREYLNENQYVVIEKWCKDTFNTDKFKLRVRRMSFDTFWFSSERDLDWFVLNWSGVDIADI